MPRWRIVLMTVLTLCAFASNSLLCRAALRTTRIDAASFTTIRLIAGALVLALIVQLQKPAKSGGGNWRSALALFVYAAAFSFAYVQLPTGTGALILFGAVQATMIGYGLSRGERFSHWQIAGFCLAVGGLIFLLLPGLSAPPLPSALMIMLAGAAWGIYSIRGRGAGDPTRVTAGNFIRSVPPALGLSLLTMHCTAVDSRGVWLAIASGALASGLGYVCWYSILPSLQATVAATLQLSVPIIAAIGGILFLHEPFTTRLAIASVTILGGIALVVVKKRPRAA